MLPTSVPAGSRKRFPLRNGVFKIFELACRIAQELDFGSPGPGPGAWEGHKARAVPGTAQASAEAGNDQVAISPAPGMRLLLEPLPKSKRAAGAGIVVLASALAWGVAGTARYERIAPSGAAVAPCLLWFAGLFEQSRGVPHPYQRQVGYVVT
eukprot:gene17142-biopygen20343